MNNDNQIRKNETYRYSNRVNQQLVRSRMFFLGDVARRILWIKCTFVRQTKKKEQKQQ